MQRSDGRALDQIRAINFELNIAPHASGSVLVSTGNTRVICGVMIEEIIPHDRAVAKLQFRRAQTVVIRAENNFDLRHHASSGR